MNEKFSIKTEKREEGGVVRELDREETEKIQKAGEKFEITRNIYRKMSFDSAEKILEEWLKLKEIKTFQRTYQKSCPQS